MKETSIPPCFSHRDRLLEALEEGAYLDFLNNVSTRAEITYISLTFPIDSVDPLACLEELSTDGEFQFFWEMPQQGLAISAGGELVSVQADGPSRFEHVHDRIDEINTCTATYTAASHRYSGLNFLGGFSFHDENVDPLWESFRAASFSVPEWMIIKDGDQGLLTITLDISGFTSADQINHSVREKLLPFSKLYHLDPSEVTEHRNTHSPGPDISLNWSPAAYSQWVESVKEAKAYIDNDCFEKIVLAREVVVNTPKKPAPVHIVNGLRRRYPNCYSFLIRKKGGTFIGSSPERLAAFNDRVLYTEALAGSIERGVTATDDSALARQLLESPKNTSEHYYVVKAIEQKLEPFALDVDRNTLPGIKKFTNVQHLSTPITVRLKDSNNRFSILKALHPTPAVGGYPWKHAARFLPKLERFSRGWYAGPVGWLNANGNGEFAVAIRSGLIRDTEARFYAGCGIVADSDPDAEWKETNLKLMPMLSALRYD